jgi:hypothetical protein
MPARYPEGIVPAASKQGGPARVASADPEPFPAGVAPDVTGLSARQALALFGRLNVSVRLSGTGFVVAQNPAPGAPLRTGGAMTLSLSESAPTVARGGVGREETSPTPDRP